MSKKIWIPQPQQPQQMPPFEHIHTATALSKLTGLFDHTGEQMGEGERSNISDHGRPCRPQIRGGGSHPQARGDAAARGKATELTAAEIHQFMFCDVDEDDRPTLFLPHTRTHAPVAPHGVTLFQSLLTVALVARPDGLFRIVVCLASPIFFTLLGLALTAAIRAASNSISSRNEEKEVAAMQAADVGGAAAVEVVQLQPEIVGISARSYRRTAGTESSSRVVELDRAGASRREVAAEVKQGTAYEEKGKSVAAKVDQLPVERTEPVVLEAIGETTSAVVQVAAESTSRGVERYYFSPSPHRRIKRTITSWTKGKHLGTGSFASVYEAILDDGSFFAVKEVWLNAKQQILQLEHEISLLSRLEHENIVQYFGTDKGDGKLYIFLELASQGSLQALYQKYHLQDSQVSAYTRQILHGLHYLHQQNVLHRDVKCANILVNASGLVKLADFGLAKEMSKSQAKSSKGTVLWMAPEVAKAMPHGPPADIWSLGCTVLEMLTGKVPYPDTETQYALYNKIGKGIPPEIPSTLSEDARDFIKSCVQKNPNDRPSSAQLLEHPFVQRPPQH